MEIYSPKLQKQQVNFNKNTFKSNSDIYENNNSLKDKTTKISDFDKTKIIYEECKKEINIFDKLDLLKIKFYERLKLFFEYDDKSNESISIKQNW